MLKISAILAIALTLSACGGGGSAPSGQAPDYSQPIKQAVDNLAAKYPTAPAYTGSFVLVNNVSQGFVSGVSERDVVTRLAQVVQNNPTKWPDLYKLLLSDAGLKIEIVGESVGVSKITGYTLYAANVVYTVKLTTNGLVVTY